MKRVLVAALALFSAYSGHAQQDAQFSQNMFLNQSINPGASGIKELHCFDLVTRSQWIGFEGAPQTAMLSYNGPVPTLGNVGMGATIIADQIGFEKNFSVNLSGAYHIAVGTNGAKLGLGLDLGIINKGFSGNAVAPQTNADPIVDAVINGSSSTVFDLGFGAFYYHPSKLYFGISGLRLLPQSFSISNNAKLRSHVYITAGYQHEIGKDIILKPNVLVKTDLSVPQMDFNLTAEYQKLLWLGFSYRVQDAIVANVGYNVNLGMNKSTGQPLLPLKVGLAYDYTTSGLKNKGTYTSYDSNQAVSGTNDNNRSVGSVELYLGYCFLPPVKPNFDKYVDPLFL